VKEGSARAVVRNEQFRSNSPVIGAGHGGRRHQLTLFENQFASWGTDSFPRAIRCAATATLGP